MKRIVFFLFFIILLVVLETSLANVFLIHPDLILMAIAAATLVFRFEFTLPWVILVGIFFDFFSYQTVGISVIVFTFLSYVTNFFSKRLVIGGRGAEFLAALILVVFLTVCLRIIHAFSVKHDLVETAGIFFEKQIILTAGLNFLIFWIFLKFFKRIKIFIFQEKSKLRI